MHKNKKTARPNDFLPPLSAFEQIGHRIIEGDHPAMLDDETLLKDVIFDFGRSSGPGGQHRNRKATACTATHMPTDISGEASERRRQSENRKVSISRLRRALAIRLRRNISLEQFVSTPLWEERRSGNQLAINPKHRDYPCILAEALDIAFASEFDMRIAADTSQISSTQLLKIITHEPAAFVWLNEQRKERGLSALKI
ncbi:MAG: peptide chain release factor-like protein [Phycisphaerae bacterium]|nr:peptide chain release factor-like protein [Phycisphaerae bacterium]MBT5365534.1 peptide chain release factor-like protein [Phycisphaerae bacterium]MBT6270356.1 peptide chain release factor-like protein [Phycisphaerae bacterium]MBT6281940.1 peptide chain release factor-like protein [Phycisphaerae bacterium]